MIQTTRAHILGAYSHLILFIDSAMFYLNVLLDFYSFFLAMHFNDICFSIYKLCFEI